VRGENKNQKAVTKTILPGHVQQRRVRCGKPNCRCARGEFHTAHYWAWDAYGVRYRRYIRREDVAHMKAACEAHRKWQVQERAGRREWKAFLAEGRALFASLKSEG
jgi:hypothetical protein